MSNSHAAKPSAATLGSLAVVAGITVSLGNQPGACHHRVEGKRLSMEPKSTGSSNKNNVADSGTKNSMNSALDQAMSQVVSVKGAEEVKKQKSESNQWGSFFSQMCSNSMKMCCKSKRGNHHANVDQHVASYHQLDARQIPIDRKPQARDEEDERKLTEQQFEKLSLDALDPIPYAAAASKRDAASECNKVREGSLQGEEQPSNQIGSPNRLPLHGGSNTQSLGSKGKRGAKSENRSVRRLPATSSGKNTREGVAVSNAPPIIAVSLGSLRGPSEWVSQAEQTSEWVHQSGSPLYTLSGSGSLLHTSWGLMQEDSQSFSSVASGATPDGRAVYELGRKNRAAHHFFVQVRHLERLTDCVRLEKLRKISRDLFLMWSDDGVNFSSPDNWSVWRRKSKGDAAIPSFTWETLKSGEERQSGHESFVTAWGSRRAAIGKERQAANLEQSMKASPPPPLPLALAGTSLTQISSFKNQVPFDSGPWYFEGYLHEVSASMDHLKEAAQLYEDSGLPEAGLDCLLLAVQMDASASLPLPEGEHGRCFDFRIEPKHLLGRPPRPAPPQQISIGNSGKKNTKFTKVVEEDKVPSNELRGEGHEHPEKDIEFQQHHSEHGESTSQPMGAKIISKKEMIEERRATIIPKKEMNGEMNHNEETCEKLSGIGAHTNLPSASSCLLGGHHIGALASEIKRIAGIFGDEVQTYRTSLQLVNVRVALEGIVAKDGFEQFTKDRLGRAFAQRRRDLRASAWEKLAATEHERLTSLRAADVVDSAKIREAMLRIQRGREKASESREDLKDDPKEYFEDELSEGMPDKITGRGSARAAAILQWVTKQEQRISEEARLQASLELAQSETVPGSLAMHVLGMQYGWEKLGRLFQEQAQANAELSAWKRIAVFQLTSGSFFGTLDASLSHPMSQKTKFTQIIRETIGTALLKMEAYVVAENSYEEKRTNEVKDLREYLKSLDAATWPKGGLETFPVCDSELDIALERRAALEQLLGTPWLHELLGTYFNNMQESQAEGMSEKSQKKCSEGMEETKGECESLAHNLVSTSQMSRTTELRRRIDVVPDIARTLFGFHGLPHLEATELIDWWQRDLEEQKVLLKLLLGWTPPWTEESGVRVNISDSVSISSKIWSKITSSMGTSSFNLSGGSFEKEFQKVIDENIAYEALLAKVRGLLVKWKLDEKVELPQYEQPSDLHDVASTVLAELARINEQLQTECDTDLNTLLQNE